MRENLLRLHKLQLVDLEIDKRKTALKALDDGGRARAEVERLRLEDQSARQRRQQVESEFLDAELQLKSIEEKKKKAEDLMYSGKVRNLKELEDLQKEVAMFAREIDRLSTQVLELMDRQEECRKAKEESSQALEEAEKRLQQIVEDYEKNGARLKEELAELKEERAEAAKAVPADLLKRYEKLQAQLGVLAVVGMTDAVCAGCHVSLPSHLLDAVRAARSVQTCESCRRILVWLPEND